jgi:hypothetical protein
MSRTLHRPMFRRGGSTGEGITSGLRQGYKNGGHGGAIDPYDPFDLSGYERFKKAYEEEVGPRPKSSSGADFWLNFGTNILAQPGGRPILQTLGTAAKEPLSKFQEQRAYENISKREEEKDLITSYMTARATALSESDQSQFSKQQQSEAIAGFTDELFKLTDDLAAGTITQEEHDRQKQSIFNKLGPYMKDNPAIEALYKVPDYADNAYREIKSMILSEDSAIGGADYLGPDGKPFIENGETITVAEWFSREENLAELRKKATHMYLQEAQDLNIGAITGWKGKKGGRAGYQGGELVEQEDVNIMTPQGDVAMQETIEEGTPPDQLSYQELRSRLPVEITDDIIRLMVSSAEALTDFAQIQTQQDVDNFNSKYGVNLVLPSEA